MSPLKSLSTRLLHETASMCLCETKSKAYARSMKTTVSACVIFLLGFINLSKMSQILPTFSAKLKCKTRQSINVKTGYFLQNILIICHDFNNKLRSK